MAQGDQDYSSGVKGGRIMATDKDEEIKTLKKALKIRDEETAKTIKEKDKEIEVANKIIKDQKNKITSLEEQHEVRDKEIEELKGTKDYEIKSVEIRLDHAHQTTKKCSEMLKEEKNRSKLWGIERDKCIDDLKAAQEGSDLHARQEQYYKEQLEEARTKSKKQKQKHLDELKHQSGAWAKDTNEVLRLRNLLDEERKLIRAFRHGDDLMKEDLKEFKTDCSTPVFMMVRTAVADLNEERAKFKRLEDSYVRTVERDTETMNGLKDDLKKEREEKEKRGKQIDEILSMKPREVLLKLEQEKKATDKMNEDLQKGIAMALDKYKVLEEKMKKSTEARNYANELLDKQTARNKSLSEALKKKAKQCEEFGTKINDLGEEVMLTRRLLADEIKKKKALEKANISHIEDIIEKKDRIKALEEKIKTLQVTAKQISDDGNVNLSAVKKRNKALEEKVKEIDKKDHIIEHLTSMMDDVQCQHTSCIDCAFNGDCPIQPNKPKEKIPSHAVPLEVAELDKLPKEPKEPDITILPRTLKKSSNKVIEIDPPKDEPKEPVEGEDTCLYCGKKFQGGPHPSVGCHWYCPECRKLCGKKYKPQCHELIKITHGLSHGYSPKFCDEIPEPDDKEEGGG